MELTPKEIQDGCESLAKFMGLKPREIVYYDSNGNKLSLNGYDYEVEGYEHIRSIDYIYKGFQTREVKTHKVIAPYNMMYPYSWDWLMPIADKINGMGKEYGLAIFKTYIALTVEKSNGNKYVKNYPFSHSEYISQTQTGKEAMFNLLVKFVKWYNEQSVITKVEETV